MEFEGSPHGCVGSVETASIYPSSRSMGSRLERYGGCNQVSFDFDIELLDYQNALMNQLVSSLVSVLNVHMSKPSSTGRYGNLSSIVKLNRCNEANLLTQKPAHISL